MTVPGSKSITNRALLVAALAEGRSRLSGVLVSDDTRYMVTALRGMGVAITDVDATTLDVIGTGTLRAPNTSLFLGNAGTATRFLTAAWRLSMARSPSMATTTCVRGRSARWSKRSATRRRCQRAIGVSACDSARFWPFTGRHTRIDAGLSSQFVSAVLMLAPFGARAVDVTIDGSGDIDARGYIDLTLDVMTRFGARFTMRDARTWRIEPTGYVAADLAIEPDASAATYIWAAAALTGGKLDFATSMEHRASPMRRRAPSSRCSRICRP